MRPRRRTGSRPQWGRYSEARDSWVIVNSHEIVLYVHSDSGDGHPSEEGLEAGTEDLRAGLEPSEDDDLPTVSILIRQQGRRTAQLSLTNLTLAELEAFQQIIERACNKARDVCRELDERAEQAWEQGDDSYARIYRPVPQLVVRERRIATDREGVSDRPRDAAGTSGSQSPEPGD